MGTIFSAYDIRGRLGENISVEYAWTVGKAFAEWLTDDGMIVVGTTGGTNQNLVRGFVEGLLLQGRDVIGAGNGGEVAIRDTITAKKAAGAAMISHDEVQNIEIIALYDAKGAPIRAENGLLGIGQLVESGNFLPAATKGTILIP